MIKEENDVKMIGKTLHDSVGRALDLVNLLGNLVCFLHMVQMHKKQRQKQG